MQEEILQEYELSKPCGTPLGTATLYIDVRRVPELQDWWFHGKISVSGPQGAAVLFLEGRASKGAECFVTDIGVNERLRGYGLSSWMLDEMLANIPTEVGSEPWLAGELSIVDEGAENDHGRRRDNLWQRHAGIGMDPRSRIEKTRASGIRRFSGPWMPAFDARLAGFLARQISPGQTHVNQHSPSCRR